MAGQYWIRPVSEKKYQLLGSIPRPANQIIFIQLAKCGQFEGFKKDDVTKLINFPIGADIWLQHPRARIGVHLLKLGLKFVYIGPIGLSSCGGGTQTWSQHNQVAGGATLMELTMHGSSGAPYIQAGERHSWWATRNTVKRC